MFSRIAWSACLAGLAPALAFAADPPAAGAEAHGSHGAAVIPPTVWGILVFVTVLLILWKKAFPPILLALEKRSRSIQDALEAAERARAEAKALLDQHEASLEKARGEARVIIEEGRADAERVKANIVESAKKETEELAARAKREIELAKRSAIDDLYNQATRLSVEIAAKLIHKSLNPKDHEDLIRDSIRRFAQMKKSG